jgi:O-antigen ligase
MATIALARTRVHAATERAPFVEGLFFATVFTVTFAKLQWEVAGTMSFSDVVTFVFLVAFAVYRLERFDGEFPRAAIVTLAFFAAFLLVYLIGWFNLETAESLAQWAKGMIKFLLHFLFLIAGVALIARRGLRFYWLTLAAFVGGMAANGAYGLAQLAVAETTGGNLDEAWLQPLTGGASKINIFGAIEGSFVYRVNALTGDPNHLGIEVAAGILLLLPIYLRLERGHRLRVPMALLLAFLAIVDLATLSRSGLLGLGCGFLVLAVPYRRVLLRAQFLVPLGLLLIGLAVFVAQRANFFEQVLSSRLSTEGRGADTHFIVYSFIPDVLAQNPLFGLGLNTFSVYYEFQTGKTNFGPHSFYVASFVEYGLVGTLVFAAFLVYLFRRAGLTRRIGRALAAEGDPLAARIRPLGWGLTAALVSTMVSNVFYLTMSFYYFYVLALLMIAAPTAVAHHLAARR